MRYIVRTSVVRVLGVMWMPTAPAATELTLTDSDVKNARDDEGKITRESVSRWLDSHSGDFSDITDWCASIEYGDDTIDIPWSVEDNEAEYTGLMYPCEDD